MNMLRRIMAADSGGLTKAPWDNYWYTPEGLLLESDAGVRVTPESAQTLSAVWNGVTLLTEGVAALPPITYRRLPNNKGKERATDHPLYDVLRWQPNDAQTAFEFFEMLMGHLVLRRQAFAQIVPGPRGFADQLVPLHPDRIRPEKLPNGRLRFVRTAGDGPSSYTQDEIFYLRGRSSDGITPLSLITYGRHSLGASMSADRYSGRFYKKNASPSGVLKSPRVLGDTAKTNLRNSVQAYTEGGHGFLILEDGLEWQQIGIDPDKSQLILTREWGVYEVARWLNIPAHMLKESKTPTFASIEAFQIEWVMHSLRPWLIRFEQCIRRDLILAKQTYFSEFLINALLRGDMAARQAFYREAILDGWMTRNEVRDLEDKNPLDGLDEPLEPRNMAPAGSQGQDTGSERRKNPQQAQTLARAAVQRVLRRETLTATKLGSEHGADVPAWRHAIGEFFEKHTAFVGQALGIDYATAAPYTHWRSGALDPEHFADGEPEAAEWLMGLALGTRQGAAA